MKYDYRGQDAKLIDFSPEIKIKKTTKKIMTFLELKEQFENKLTGNYKFELLELHFAPYSFGSGMTAYRIKGRIVNIIYDGRDNEVQLLISSPHDNYINSSWTTIFTGLPDDFIDSVIANLISFYGQNA
jgi:hypothetical protein